MKKGTGLMVLLIVGIVAASGIVSAFCGFGGQRGFGLGPELTEDMKEDMKQANEGMQNAIETKDFPAWKALMEERIARMKESLTEENFNRIVERHNEMSEKRANMEQNMGKMRGAEQSGNIDDMNKTWERPCPRGMFSKSCDENDGECPGIYRSMESKMPEGRRAGFMGRIKGLFSKDRSE